MSVAFTQNLSKEPPWQRLWGLSLYTSYRDSEVSDPLHLSFLFLFNLLLQITLIMSAHL